jgi:hypothetical protein
MLSFDRLCVTGAAGVLGFDALTVDFPANSLPDVAPSKPPDAVSVKPTMSAPGSIRRSAS